MITRSYRLLTYFPSIYIHQYVLENSDDWIFVRSESNNEITMANCKTYVWEIVALPASSWTYQLTHALGSVDGESIAASHNRHVTVARTTLELRRKTIYILHSALYYLFCLSRNASLRDERDRDENVAREVALESRAWSRIKRRDETYHVVCVARQGRTQVNTPLDQQQPRSEDTRRMT